MPTKRLFWEDPSLAECQATVTGVIGSRVWLDRTVFFAFSGGQESDEGTINGIRVQEATDGEEISYTLEQPPQFKEGDTVTVRINPEKRCLITRLHSATHLVWVALFKRIGSQTVAGSNISIKKGRIDLLFPENISPRLPGVEKEVNEMISKNLPVKIWFDPPGSTQRWWEVQGYERVPCSGTHARSTGEIGAIRLKRKNIGAGKERVEITLA